MKILYATFGYLPAVAWGGPVKVVDENARELMRRGYGVAVCASNRMSKSERLSELSVTKEIDGLRVSYLDTHMLARWRGTTGPTWLSPGGMRMLWKEVQSADLIHAHGTRNAVVISAVLFAIVQRKPFVLQPHGTLPHIVTSIRLKRVFDWAFTRGLLRRADALIALQAAEKEQIIHAGGEPEKIWIIPNGISRQHSIEKDNGAFRSRFSLRSDRSILLFLGRINYKKGVDLLVEAYAGLPEALREDTQLVVAGPDDGQLPEVNELVARRQIGEHVTFTGELSALEARCAMVDADIFILPCRRDTFPMVIVEACAAGKPMVVTETCEIADLLSGKAATIVPAEASEISRAMQELVESSQLREKYHLGGLELVDSIFSIHNVGDLLERVYSRVMTGVVH